jgi:hypothetical protein
MNAQQNFFVLPEEMREVEQRLQSRLRIQVVSERAESSTPKLIGMVSYELSDQPRRCYLVSPDLVNSIVMRYVPAQGYWTIDVLKSPVIELDKSFFDGRILKPGRMYCESQFLDDSGELVVKPEIFLKWSKSVMNSLRKSLVKNGRSIYYVGGDTMRKAEAGEIQLVNGFGQPVSVEK